MARRCESFFFTLLFRICRTLAVVVYNSSVVCFLGEDLAQGQIVTTGIEQSPLVLGCPFSCRTTTISNGYESHFKEQGWFLLPPACDLQKLVQNTCGGEHFSNSEASFLLHYQLPVEGTQNYTFVSSFYISDSASCILISLSFLLEILLSSAKLEKQIVHRTLKCHAKDCRLTKRS